MRTYSNNACAAALLCAIVAIGCKAEAPEGIFACEMDNECPGGQFCHADGFCYGKQEAHPHVQRSDASTDREDASSDAATPDAGPAPEGGTVHAPGDVCDAEARTGCAGFDSRTALACVKGAWTETDKCAADQRCDTRSEATQGECLDLVPECADKAPGDAFCRGNDRMTCGPDRVTATVEHCPEGNVCVLNDGKTTCVSDEDECAKDSDDCDDDPNACLNVLGSFECRCPDHYQGDGRGSHGCSDVLECDTKNGGCDTDPMASCKEVVGGLPTCKCPSGYEGKGVGSRGCVDSDECADGAVEACGDGATDCTNTDGGYRCACDVFHVLAADERSCRLRAWGGEVRIDEAHTTGDALGPAVGLDAAGDAIVVWQQNDGTTGNIWANRYTAGDDWDTAELIEHDDDGSAFQPGLSVDAGGSAIALWLEYVDSEAVTWASRYMVAHGWSSPAMVTSHASDSIVGGVEGSSRLAMTDADSAVAVWSFFDSGYYDTWGSRYTKGSWSNAVFVGGYASGVALDADDNALVLLAVSDGANSEHTKASRSVGSGAWDSPTDLESTSGSSDLRRSIRPMGLTMDGSGNAIAVWHQLTRGSVSDSWSSAVDAVWTNRYTSGVGWGSAATISTNDVGDAVGGPAVAASSLGDAMAVWPQSNGTNTRVWASLQPAGQAWLNPTPIGQNSVGEVANVSVAMDAAGTAIAVWQQSDGTHVHIWANRYVVDNGWETAVQLDLDNDSHDAVIPALAVNAAGGAIVAWQQSDGTHYNIWASRFE